MIARRLKKNEKDRHPRKLLKFSNLYKIQYVITKNLLKLIQPAEIKRNF